jgi:dTDP-4-amino-4,6-dideoxygalactose transaminase
MVLTSDEDLAGRVRRLRNHGAESRYYHRIVGGTFRLDALQAAVLAVKLDRLDGWTRARQQNAATYRTLFERSGLLAAGALSLPLAAYADSGVARGHIYHQFVIRTRERDALRSHLVRRGIGTELYYPVALHLQECFAHLGHRPGDFPEAERAARETLALPIYAELTMEQQALVVSEIRNFYA